FSLEGLYVCLAEMFGLGIEKTTIGAADTIGSQRLLQVVGLEQDGQARQRALRNWRRRQRGERRPEMLLDLGGNRHALAPQDRDQPVGGPGPLGDIVDPGERLKGHAVFSAFGKPTAKIVPVAAHGERGGADRSAKVEGEDL